MLETVIQELIVEIRKLTEALNASKTTRATVEPTVQTVEAIASRTVDDVKTLLRQWVKADPTRNEQLIPMFEATTGLKSLKEVSGTNASSVYAQLEAAFARG